MTVAYRSTEADRKLAYSDLGRVLVLGRGVTGTAVLSYLEPLIGTRVRAVEVWEGEPGEGSFDLCIASPGISEFSELYQCARNQSSEIISEVEFAWRESSATSRWIAVTGTNGKTTTTSLIAHILRCCGQDVRLVGNIGDACIEAVAKDTAPLPLSSEERTPSPPFITYVVEMSSYQLASTVNFAANVAVVLNIKPDHLSWHRTHENYAAAKWNILKNASLATCAVLNAVDDEVRARIRALRQEEQRLTYIPLGTKEGIDKDMRQACGSEHAAFVDAQRRLHVAYQGRDHALACVDDLKILGAHNVENALAAASAAIAFAAQPRPFDAGAGAPLEHVEPIGIDDAALTQALCAFEPIPHRIETVAERFGIRFVNDSKATNVDATLAALTAFPNKNAIIMLGGRDKGTDLSELVRAVARSTKGCVLFGESYERFSHAFDEEGVPYVSATGLADASERAYGMAEEGDVILLSPACASFDEFSCFEERGERFAEIARTLLGKRS